MANPTRPRRLWLRIARHPIVWTTLGVFAILVGTSTVMSIVRGLGDVGAAVAPLVGAVLAVLLYLLFRRGLGGRATPELAARGAARELLWGTGAGVAFLVVSVGIIALFGGLTFTWSLDDAAPIVLSVVAVSIGAAVTEELVFRGLLLQSIALATGRWVALAITAVLFGAMHLGNPGATIWSAIAIAIEAGVLLGAAFLWRGSLWFAIGLHFGWNTVQGLLGIPVSGIRDPGLLVRTAHGPAWLSGGDFGVEASAVPVVLGAVLSALMIVATVASGRRAAAAERDHDDRDLAAPAPVG